MNKKIKFRGKTKKYGNWAYGSLATIQNQGWFILPEYIENVENVQQQLYPIEKDTIGQFLLIEDKEGEEVYDGDIYNNLDNGLIGLLEIRSNTGGLYVNCVEWKDGKLWNNHAFSLHDTTNFIVIGSIVDNRELIPESYG